MPVTNKKLTTTVENDTAYWRNVPASVWTYKLGGYQVLKKWLSYREQKVLGRPLNPENPRRSPTLYKHRLPHSPDIGSDGVMTRPDVKPVLHINYRAVNSAGSWWISGIAAVLVISIFTTSV